MKSMNRSLKCYLSGIHRKKCKMQLSICPIVRRYFYLTPENITIVDIPFRINANLFCNDEGNPVHSFKLFRGSGYLNLYINGVMQGSSLYTVNANALILKVVGQTLIKGTPIIIESIGFKLCRKKIVL